MGWIMITIRTNKVRNLATLCGALEIIMVLAIVPAITTVHKIVPGMLILFGFASFVRFFTKELTHKLTDLLALVGVVLIVLGFVLLWMGF